MSDLADCGGGGREKRSTIRFVQRGKSRAKYVKSKVLFKSMTRKVPALDEGLLKELRPCGGLHVICQVSQEPRPYMLRR